jgi:RNA polymerase sporulation-specific sigma factor
MEENIINSCKPLINSIAGKFYGIDKEDLYQAGVVGVINAYKHYKENNNTKFSTFAYQYIFGEMYNLSIKNNLIKQNKDTIKLVKLINKAKNYLILEYKKEPSIKDIADYLQIDESIIGNTINSTNSILSLDKEIESDSTLYNTIESNYDNTGKYIDLKDSISNLDKEEQDIINLRYMYNLTQNETAKVLGLNQVKVSRYEKRSLNKLQQYLS